MLVCMEREFFFKKTLWRLAACGVFLSALTQGTLCAQQAGSGIASRTAEIDGLRIHYLIAGHGPAVVLLHGYAETSLMWRPLMPLLANKFTVIAPDLPGIGDSGIP